MQRTPIEPLWDDPFTLDGLLARFWKRLEYRPEMASYHRKYLLHLYTYSYGNELWIKQNHRREKRLEWRDRVRFHAAFRFPESCWACDEQEPEHWHHIVPLARGGDNRRENLVPLCQPCHDAVHRGDV